MSEYVIYAVDNYLIKNYSSFLKKQAIKFDSIKNICEELKNNKYYHFRVHNKQTYIFFGDIDGYDESIINFIKKLKEFLKEFYNLSFNANEFMYTESDKKKDLIIILFLNGIQQQKN